jgi:hypothetical protein
MARIFPGGGSVRRGFPVRAAEAATWTIVYDVNLTEEATSSGLDTDDTISIAGVTWTVKNGKDSAYCDDFKMINGTGLQISFAIGDSDSDQYGTTDTCPRIETAVSNLVSGLAVDDTIAIQLLAESGGLNDNWQLYGMTISSGGASSNDWITNRTLYNTGYSGSNVGNDVRKGDNGRYLPSAGTAAEPGFRELVWYCGGSSFVAGADAAAALQDPLTCTQMEVFGLVSDGAAAAPAVTPTLDITIANATLQLVAMYNDEGGSTASHAYSARFTRLRVLRREK